MLNRCVPPKINCILYREYVCFIHLDLGHYTKNSKDCLVFSRVFSSKLYAFFANYNNIILHPKLDSLLNIQVQSPCTFKTNLPGLPIQKTLYTVCPQTSLHEHLGSVNIITIILTTCVKLYIIFDSFIIPTPTTAIN